MVVQLYGYVALLGALLHRYTLSTDTLIDGGMHDEHIVGHMIHTHALILLFTLRAPRDDVMQCPV